MKSVLTIILIVAFGLVGIAIWLSNSPNRAARTKCERQLKLVIRDELNLTNLSMHVTGDENSRKVQVTFIRAGELRVAECILEWGEVRRLRIDGKEIPGR